MYQRVRTVLFYTSIIVFFVSVPLTLIFSLGYDVSWRHLKFSRAGLINVTSQPEGAVVFLNNKDTGQTTPSVLKELKPGMYDLRLQLPDYYPWQNTVEVKDGMVTDLKEVVLFKRLPYIEKINIEEISDFALNKNHSSIFFISKEDNFIYKIDNKGKSSQLVYKLPFSAERVKKWLISPDEKKIIYVVGNKLYIGFLFSPESTVATQKDFMIAVGEEIIDVFWHSDDEHIIVATVKEIRIYELFSQGLHNTISLINFNFRRPRVIYDMENNAIYFTDLQETSVGRYNNLYKIQLGKHQIFPLVEDLEKR